MVGGFSVQKQEILEIEMQCFLLSKGGEFLGQRRVNVVPSVLFPSSPGHNQAQKCKKNVYFLSGMYRSYPAADVQLGADTEFLLPYCRNFVLSCAQPQRLISVLVFRGFL